MGNKVWGLVVIAAVMGGCGDDTMVPPEMDAEFTCVTDEQCDDRVFCNGFEECAPAAEGADERGCIQTARCMPSQECSEEGSECISDCESASDADGDGAVAAVCGGDDCDDADPGRFPGNPEICDDDNVDEDCDPSTFGERDGDGDGSFDAMCCNEMGGTLVCGDDCDDARADVSPTNTEACDLRDNDCDSSIDEEVQLTFYRDADNDNFGDPAMELMSCDRPEGYVFNDTDCDDRNEHANSETASERCDGFDNDCDGESDEGLLLECYTDGDSDGFAPMGAVGRTECGSCPERTTAREPTPGNRDCNDSRPDVNPERVELCDGGGVDEDCDGTANPESLCDCTPGEVDTCAEVYGLLGVCAAGTVSCVGGMWGDCTIAPMTETCATGDQNCNGVEDDDEASDRENLFVDSDRDGFGDPARPVLACPRDGLVDNDEDCFDDARTRFPGADELCNDIDDDCDGLPDNDAGITQWVDDDRDTYGFGDPIRNCVMLPTHTNRGGDCDDMNEDVFPGAPEICDDVDNDCGGEARDEDDADADAWCASRENIDPTFRTPTCQSDGCDFDCAGEEPGENAVYGNCDDDDANGCETFFFDDRNCGGCGTICNDTMPFNEGCMLLDAGYRCRGCDDRVPGSPSGGCTSTPGSPCPLNCDDEVPGCETPMGLRNCGSCDNDCRASSIDFCISQSLEFDPADLQCESFPESGAQCGNGVDDDFDGRSDEGCAFTNP